MAEAQEPSAKAGKDALIGRVTFIGRRLIAFVLKPPPWDFTPANFAARMGQHLVVYMAVLIVAVLACLVVSARS
jgi:hypothetical protein